MFLSEFGIIVLLINKKKKCNSRVMRETACSNSSLKGHELNFYFIYRPIYKILGKRSPGPFWQNDTHLIRSSHPFNPIQPKRLIRSATVFFSSNFTCVVVYQVWMVCYVDLVSLFSVIPVFCFNLMSLSALLMRLV